MVSLIWQSLRGLFSANIS